MNRPSISAIHKAVRNVVGFTPGAIRIGFRNKVGGGDTGNMLQWEPDADLNDNLLLDVWALKAMDYTNGCLMDLYVYNRDEDLETNVTVVVSSEYEVLTAYDNVGSVGADCDSWWAQR